MAGREQGPKLPLEGVAMVFGLSVGGAAGQGTPGNMQDVVTETTPPTEEAGLQSSCSGTWRFSSL